MTQVDEALSAPLVPFTYGDLSQHIAGSAYGFTIELHWGAARYKLTNLRLVDFKKGTIVVEGEKI